MLNSLISTGLIIIEWLRTEYPGLYDVMEGISFLGRFEIYLLIVLLVYWCIDKEKGKQLMLLMGLTNVFAIFFKQILRGPRPYWIRPEWGGDGVDGYGLPSGSATSVAVMFSFIAAWVQKRRWLVVLCVLWIALVGLSRVYLAAHFPHDVLAGYFLATLLLIGFFWWVNYMQPEFSQRILGQRFWTAVTVPFLIGLAFAVWVLFVPRPALIDQSVAVLAEAAEQDGISEMIAGLGILLGLGAGFVFERRDVRFIVDGLTGQRVGRYLFGLLLVGGVLVGLDLLFGLILAESAGVTANNLVDFIRYLAVALMASLFAPMLMVRLGLMSATPKPPLRGGMNRLKKPFQR